MKTMTSPARRALGRAAISSLLAFGVLAPIASPASAAVTTRTVTVSKSGTGTGTVAATSATKSYSCGTTCTTTQSWTFPQGETVTFTATPTASSSFGGWSGACTGTTCSFKLSGNASLSAAFAINRYALTVSKIGTGVGTVTSTSSPTQTAQIACGPTCSATYNHGTAVTLVAAAATGSVFAGWSGAGCGGTSTCAVSLTSAQTVTATFTAVEVLTVDWYGGGAGTVTSLPSGIACSAGCSATFARGSSVTLGATASAGSVFLGWSGACEGLGSCTVTLSGPTDVEAVFAPDYGLAILPRGSGAGTISSADGRIDCGASCTAVYVPTTCEGCGAATASTVELTALPAIGSVFVGWNGGGCVGTDPCTVTVAQALRVDAVFTLASYTVAVATDGAGVGAVRSSDGAIDCPGTCSAVVAHGETLTLVATPDATSAFGGWAGAGCAGAGATCQVTITGDASFTATFLPTEPLTLLRSGNGSGAVTSSPAGISCGSTCSARFVRGTSVSLEASPTIGSVFTGWTGACSGTGACTVTLDAAAEVGATFALEPEDLTVVLVGPGSVSSTPAGIACGSDCVETWDYGTSVTLVAAPDPSSLFVGWSGVACSSGSQTAASCTFTLTGPAAATATFVPAFTLTVSRAGNGTGSVASTPAGIACGTTCQVLLPAGSTVALAATPGTGSNFTAWGGDCSGAGACSVVMDGPRSVSATFTLQIFSVALTIDGTGVGTVAVSPTGSCSSSCTLSFDYGTVVSLTPNPASYPLSTFAGWGGTGGGCKSKTVCSFTITADRQYIATFTRITYTLSLTRNVYAGGNGTIAVVGTSLTCGTSCSSAQWQIDGNAGVTLQATPATDGVSAFTSWSGVLCDEGTQTGLTCTFLMGQARDITAGFGTPQPLTVQTTGTGGGWVTGPGIDCPTDCADTTVAGRNVALYADPGPFSSFGSWSDPSCGTASVCVLVISGPTSISARFDPMLVLVTLGKGSADGGTGAVVSSPNAISCAVTCTAQEAWLPLGTSVTLTATPASDAYFVGWTGRCAGTATSCTFTLDGNVSVTATFGRPVLRLTKAGNGTGTVATSVTGFKCSTSCTSAQALYAPGTLVTLTASPSNGSGLAAWSGDCAGVALTCTVTMDRARNVTATFGKLVTVSVSSSGSGTLTSLAPSTRIACGATCSATFATGATVTILATPATGQVFSSWTAGPCTGSTTSTCTFTLAGATSLRAAFVAG